MGLTQSELAARTELTKGFISQIEHEQTSPSIATLTDILQVLGTNLSDFFSEEEPTQVVFHKKDFFEKIDEEYKNTIEWIVPNAQKNTMEPIRLTLEAGGCTIPDNPHEGEEFGYVLSGSIVITLGKQKFTAKRGEAFYYVPDKTHYLSSKSGAKILWISSPPYF